MMQQVALHFSQAIDRMGAWQTETQKKRLLRVSVTADPTLVAKERIECQHTTRTMCLERLRVVMSEILIRRQAHPLVQHTNVAQQLVLW